MKHSVKRTTSIAVLTAVLASFASMTPAVAASDVYSLSYETLTAVITTESGNTIPAGTTAVTMSIDGNSGFNSDTLAVEIDNGYSVMTDSDGKPIIQTGEVLEGFMTSSAVTNNKVCVAAASAAETFENGELFTVYLTPSAAEMSIYRTTESAATIVTAAQNNARSAGIKVGDVDYNGSISSMDAASLMVACGRNQIGDSNTNIMPILYAYLKRDYSEYSGTDIIGKYRLFYTDENNVKKPIDPRCMNCYDESYCIVAANTVDTRMINDNDSQEILDYSAAIGSGGSYTGMVGMDIDSVETLNTVSSAESEVAAAAARSVIYRYNMDVTIFNDMSINGINTFWLPALISKHNYDYKVDLVPAQEFENVCQQNPTFDANTDPELWVMKTLGQYDVWPFLFDGGKDYIRVYDAINGDKPIYCQFTNGYTSKAVLICGYTLYSDGTAIYQIMDPEYATMRTTYVSQTEMLNGSTLAYPATGYTWHRGYYDTMQF